MLLRFSSPALNDAVFFLFIVLGVVIALLIIRTLLEAVRALRAYSASAQARYDRPGRAPVRPASDSLLSAPAVPPENPHAPPTPALGVRRPVVSPTRPPSAP